MKDFLTKQMDLIPKSQQKKISEMAKKIVKKSRKNPLDDIENPEKFQKRVFKREFEKIVDKSFTSKCKRYEMAIQYAIVKDGLYLNEDHQFVVFDKNEKWMSFSSHERAKIYIDEYRNRHFYENKKLKTVPGITHGSKIVAIVIKTEVTYSVYNM